MKISFKIIIILSKSIIIYEQNKNLKFLQQEAKSQCFKKIVFLMWTRYIVYRKLTKPDKRRHHNVLTKQLSLKPHESTQIGAKITLFLNTVTLRLRRNEISCPS